MKHEISFNTESGQSFDVIMSAKNIGSEKWDNMKHEGWHYKYRVTISVNGNKTSFTYGTSINDFNNGKNEMDEKDMQFALYCFLSDATAADNSFEDFCNEFGYNTDSRNAEKTYKACVKANEKAIRLFGSDLWEVMNAVNELENA